MKLFEGVLALAAVEAQVAWNGACTEVTTFVERTNTWDCRDCFNLRVNFNLDHLISSWNGVVYMSFTEETSLVKIAGPGEAVEFANLDENDNHLYEMTFEDGHEYGDGRIDVNAEFRELGGNPQLASAWVCPHDHMICNKSTNPFKVSNGHWACTSARGGQATVCKAICDKGLEEKRKQRSTLTRCQKFANHGFPAGSWRSGKFVDGQDGDAICE